jgi:hypothetical protein
MGTTLRIFPILLVLPLNNSRFAKSWHEPGDQDNSVSETGIDARRQAAIYLTLAFTNPWELMMPAQ